MIWHCCCAEDGTSSVLPLPKLNNALSVSYVSIAIGAVVQSNRVAAGQLIQLCTQVSRRSIGGSQ